MTDATGGGEPPDLVAGAVDLHLHCGPSLIERRGDGFDLAVEAAEAGMDAIVLKEHFFPTVHGVPHVERRLADAGVDVDVYGSVVLNYCNGGFNPFAVTTALDSGARAIWGPTIDARHHADRTGSLGAFLGVEAAPAYDDVDGLEALDGDGDLRSDVRRCVEAVADADALLCLGHLSFEETRCIAEYAADLGHGRLVVDHPTYHVTGLDLDQQRELVALGAVMNFPFLAISEAYGWTTPAALADNIRALGVDHCVVSSDVGQAASPSSPDALRRLGESLLDAGLAAEAFHELVATTPRRLLGLD